MGNNCNVNCNKNTIITYQTLTTISESYDFIQQYTLLKDNYLIAGQKICKFINFNYRRLICKQKYRKMILKLESIFDVESINFPKKKEYFIELFNKKINFFFENKIEILENIFEEEKILSKIHDFEALKNMIKNYYANEICYNRINFYQNFFDYIQKKKKTKSFFNNIYEEEKEGKLKSSVKKLMRIQKIFKSDKGKDDLFNSQITFIEKDLDNLFQLCLSTDVNNLTKKIDEIENKSYLLMLFSDELKLNNEFFIYEKLRIFLKFFYYLYLLKKNNFISSTNKFNKISKEEFNSTLTNKNFYININDIESFKLLKKIKLFQLAFNKNKRAKTVNPSKFNLLDSEINTNNSENDEFNFDILKENNIYSHNKINIEEFTEINTSNYIPVITEAMNKNNIDNEHFIKRKSTINQVSPLMIEEKLKKINTKQKNKSPKRLNRIVRINSLEKKPISKNINFNNRLSANVIPTNNINYNKTLNINLLNNKNKNEDTKIELYNGEYDNTLYLYAGMGILIKPRNSSLYNGTFRYGKKEGFGIYYRQLSEYHFKYYMGEFTNNKFDGFGFLLELNYKYSKILKGNFHNSNFINGIIVTFTENKNDILEVSKYEGEVEEKVNNNYIIFKNYGHLTKISYRLNKNKTKYEKESEYDYTGYFKEGKENGEGYLKYNLKNQGYYYEYQGNFIDGEINGYGIINFSDNFFIKKYEGFFDGNGEKSFSNYGIVYFKSGDIYEGFFDEKHLKTLCGIYWHYNNKNIDNMNCKNDNFFGEFFEDMKCGFGRYISFNENNGKLLIGKYQRGAKNGVFELIYEEEDEKLNNDNKKFGIGNFFSKNKFVTRFNLLTQKKKFYVFEEGDLLERSDKEIKPFWIKILG